MRGLIIDLFAGGGGVMNNPLTQTIPKDETPTIRLLHDVRGNYIFAGTKAPAGIHKAYMNMYGAVSVEAEVKS